MPVVVEILSNLRSQVFGLDEPTTTAVQLALTVDVPGAEYSMAYREHRWDGRRHFFDRRTRSFPTGLLHKVKAAILGAGFRVQKIYDRRPAPPVLPYDSIRSDMLVGLTLYDYQLDAIRAFVEKRCGIIWAATNAGKSACASGIIKVLPPDAWVLYVVHKKVLLEQARLDTAKHLGLPQAAIGTVGGGRAFAPKRITIATVQTLRLIMRRPSVKAWFAKIALLVMDEVHHAKSATHYTVAKAVNASYRLGLSAIPFPSEDAKFLVQAATGPVIARVTNDELIQRGVSAKPTVEIISYAAPEMDDAMEWFQTYQEGIIQSPERNSAIATRVAELALSEPTLRRGLRKNGRRRRYSVRTRRQTLVQVSQIWHGDLLSMLFRAQGIPHRFIHAKLPLAAIQHAQARFEAFEFPVLIASPIFDEGVNVKDVEALVIADGGKSVRKILQQVGRALRKKIRGDNVVRIVDFDDQHHDILARHSLQRLAIYEAEGFDVVQTTAKERPYSSDEMIVAMGLE